MEIKYAELNELRSALDAKQISSVELTKYFLERIKNFNPNLNAYITVTEDVALSQAKEADDYIATSGANPLLSGIPYAAKDLFCTKDILTTAASKILGNYKAPYDATIIKKLKEQKGVLLGKTNLDEFAHGSSGETSAFGASKNPWDTTRMPGGSSSGSAAAVSADLAAWSIGTETGGSIRVPGAFCNLSAWKPTYGRISRYGSIAMASSLDSVSALAKSVKDLAMIAQSVSGKDGKDGSAMQEDVPNYYENLAKDIKGLRVGVPKEYFEGNLEDGTRQKVLEAIQQLKNLGAEIIDVSLPNTKYGSLVYAIICPSEVASNLARYDGIRYGHSSADAKNLLEVYTKSRAEGFGKEAKRRVMTGTYILSAGYFDAYYKKAAKVRTLLVNEFREIFKQVDVLACPTVPGIAQKLGHAADDPIFGYVTDQLNIPASLAGLPALSIPCGFSKPVNGDEIEMPVGFQIIGPQKGDQKIFDVGHVYQLATDWHKKYPNFN